MDQSNYRQTKTKRGFIYSYYFSPPASGKPVLFFSHGFPSNSTLWKQQVPFFQQRGYGVIVPDHLGYGGTDKPTDAKLYSGRGLSGDIVDIFDAEKIDKVIAIGHDWGSYVVSRVLHYFPQRVSASAFLAVGYLPIDGALNVIRDYETVLKLFGADIFAYQRFFIHPDAPAIIEKNIDSFVSLLYPETPEQWKTTLSVDGATRTWVETNTIKPLPSYMTPEDAENLKASLLSGGVSAPLCFYKANNEDANIEEDAKLPASARVISMPILYIAFTKDFVASPAFADGAHQKYVKGPLTRKEIPADHWGMMSHPTEINNLLLEWLETL
ncbi:epoxide hydrolase [Favolaschia claudopus]|uniref:Epoxide hydrolase n=1 Tax=Favolaschia claudopus TaxID=2862362 RepID=A0AAW0D6F8_9AGAR